MITSSRPTALAHCRRLRGWSQAVLAEKSTVSRTEISAIEIGRLVPSVAVALRLAAALGESAETIFGSTDLTPAIKWAWPPTDASDRCWWASLNHQLLAYPVEHTAAGSIPHDAVTRHGGARTSQRAGAERTLVIAGCDPIVGLLVQQMAARHGIRVVPLLRSSAQALDLLRQGLVHAAGIHLTDPAGHSTNDPSVKSAVGTGYRLLHQVRWDTGIAVVNGRTEPSAAALLRSNVRWVNREEGSAARRVLDDLLVSRRRPVGYTHIVGDHRAVAATVSSGWAEAGICVMPAAVEARLRFIPLHQEAYELCVANAQLDDPRIAALVATLQSAAYRQLIADIPGCIARETGNVRLVA